MRINLLKSKIHRATITDSDLNYEGSIGIDGALMEASGLLPYEQVDVLDIQSGSRFTTYVIEEEAGSGKIVVNGAAARLVQKGDLVIIVSYASFEEAEVAAWQPCIVRVDHQNKVKKG